MGMTFEMLVQHPVYTHLLKYANSTEGREKLLRFLQYFIRFLRSLKFQSVISPQFGALLSSLQATFALSRKPLRALKPLNHLKSLSICISDQLSDPILRYSEALKQVGFFLFFTLDTVQWLKILGLLGGKGVNEKYGNFKIVKNANTYAAGMWCVALIGGLIKNFRQFQILLMRHVNNCEKSKSQDIPYMSVHKLKRDFLKNLMDFTIAVNLYKNYGIDDGIIGGFGVITSIMGIQDIWNSSK